VILVVQGCGNRHLILARFPCGLANACSSIRPRFAPKGNIAPTPCCDVFSSLKLFRRARDEEAFDDYPLLDPICGGNVRPAGQSVLP
jgi:hypothetical protein